MHFMRHHMALSLALISLFVPGQAPAKAMSSTAGDHPQPRIDFMAAINAESACDFSNDRILLAAPWGDPNVTGVRPEGLRKSVGVQG